MNKNYKNILTIISAFLILTVGIGVSYSIYNIKKSDIKNYTIVETDEVISVNYLDGKEFNINDFKPGDVVSKKISITNVSQNNTYLTISLMNISKSSNDLSVKVLDNKKEVIYDKNISNIDLTLVSGVDLESSKTLSYTIMIENKGSETTSFSANIFAYKEVIKNNNNSFKDVILASNDIVEDQTIGKDVASTSGLIKTEDNDGQTYIFRGIIENNNVKIGENNYKILRINGDNSIRLIFDGILENEIAYNEDVSFKEDYSEKLLYNNSKVKVFLDNYLTSFLNDYSKYIVDSSFCEDVTSYKEENYVSYLNNYKRIFEDNNPSLKCEGNIIKNKIGLISADELTYAGAYQNKENKNYYLYNENIKSSYYTISGSQILVGYNAVDIITANTDGSLSYDKKISTPLGIRPVISIDANTNVSGTGTIDDPYILK